MTRYHHDDEYGDWLYHKRKDEELDRELDRLGVRAQPAPQPKPEPRPDPSKSPGIWYRDGNIPH